ncbi:transposase, partial [Deinococcus sp. DB0503]|nr:transposase [Deinococcus sp. DB0503]
TNIAAAGLRALQQGPTDTARSEKSEQASSSLTTLDGVKVRETQVSHTDSNLVSPA